MRGCDGGGFFSASDRQLSIDALREDYPITVTPVGVVKGYREKVPLAILLLP